MRFSENNDKQSVGLLGFVLFSVFCLLCVVQVYRLYVHTKYKLQFNLQLLFLVIAFMASSFDGIYFLMMMIHGRYTTIGYIFHMLGMFSSAMAFIVVVFRWNKVLQLYAESSALLGATYVLIGGNVIVTLIAVIDSTRINDYDEYIKHWSYEAVAISNCSTIFIYSLWVFFCARYVKSKLIVSNTRRLGNEGENSSHSNNVSNLQLENEESHSQLIKKLMRMNLVLGLCSLCYFLRVVCLAFVLLDVERDETTTDSISIFWWFTLSLWIPSLGSGSILLYTMRPMKASDGETVRSRRGSQRRYFAHSSEPLSGSSCPSCSTGGDSRQPSHAHYLSEDSTDSSYENNSSSYNHFDLTNTPLLSDDYGEIAFAYEAAEQKKRYRHESLSTGTFENDLFPN